MTTWLITGANRGIGLELARQALTAGHHVVATVRDPSRAQALAALTAPAGRLEVLPLEVSEASSVAALAARLAGRPIDVLVNNAGVRPAFRPAFDTDFEAFAQALAVNTISPVRVTEALVENLATARGKVVTISSMLGAFSFGHIEELAYCVTKTAVNRAMVLLADSLKERQVAVGLFSPGWVRTDMGGQSAPLSVEESVAGLMREIDALSLATTGCFRNYKGETLAW